MMFCGKIRKNYTRIFQATLFLTLALKSGKKGSIIFHEAYLGLGRNPLFNLSKGMAFSLFKNLIFHTQEELDRIYSTFPKIISKKQCKVEEHERYMLPKFRGSQQDARDSLGLGYNEKILLCIGFIQSHKAFHVAAEALRDSERKDITLYIVGSLRVTNEDTLSYKRHLLEIIKYLPNVKLVEKFIDDIEFDAWITAADMVILPYTDISSSGVGARAKILNKPLIFNGNTNLSNQFGQQKDCQSYQNHSEFVEILKIFQPNLNTNAQDNDATLQISLNDKPILFVIPWFGKDVKGGAESFIYDLCSQLSETGQQVEVWATASSSIECRNNDFLHLESDKSAPFKIRRFKSNTLSESLFKLVHPKMCQPSAGFITGLLWKMTALYGKGMKSVLQQEHENYSTIHLCHYFGGSTHRLAGVSPDKTIIHPFIHEEPQAFHSIMRDLFSGVRGVMCNTVAERKIGERAQMGLLPGLYFPIGNGINSLDQADSNLPSDRFRKDEIVFIGRLISEKNLLKLSKWLKSYNKTALRKVTLSLIGQGPLFESKKLAKNPHINFTGWLDEEEKQLFIRNALAVVQLSLFESFSLVLMESWVQKTPVIVNKKCAATDAHVTSSGGGFSVGTQKEFNEALDLLVYYPKLLSCMGEAGFLYVNDQFSWKSVLANFHNARQQIMSSIPYCPKSQKDYGGLHVKTATELPDVNDPRQLSGIVHLPPLNPATKSFYQMCGSDFYAAFEARHRDPDAGKVFPSWPDYSNYLSELTDQELWVDIGAGRGQFLEYLLKDKGPTNNLMGVEPDGTSYAQLSKLSIPTCAMYADRFLGATPDNSIRIISMLHVAEHIPFQDLCCIFKIAFDKISKDGALIVEVPFVNTIKTSATNFWEDPTHIRPLVLETLQFAMSRAGFHIESTKTYAPHLEPSKLHELATNIHSDLLAKEIYGDQDVSVVGRKT